MAQYPIPHSPEWFDALRKFNPQQAAHTSRIVELAGNAEVCSVCGDDPAGDYKVAADNIPPNAVATIRLCDDCLAIRRAGGERFEPL